jgi:uncharacterized membrane protein
MSRFVVVTFPDETKAHEGVHILKVLRAEGRITLHGLAVVARGSDGKLSVLGQRAYEGPHGAAVAALIGGLAGLPGGPVAVTLFAAGGALFGLSADLINRGAGREFVNKVLHDLSSLTKSAVIAEVSEDEGVALDARMETIGGTVLHDLSA